MRGRELLTIAGLSAVLMYGCTKYVLDKHSERTIAKNSEDITFGSYQEGNASITDTINSQPFFQFEPWVFLDKEGNQRIARFLKPEGEMRLLLRSHEIYALEDRLNQNAGNISLEEKQGLDYHYSIAPQGLKEDRNKGGALKVDVHATVNRPFGEMIFKYSIKCDNDLAQLIDKGFVEIITRNPISLTGKIMERDGEVYEYTETQEKTTSTTARIFSYLTDGSTLIMVDKITGDRIIEITPISSNNGTEIDRSSKLYREIVSKERKTDSKEAKKLN